MALRLSLLALMLLAPSALAQGFEAMVNPNPSRATAPAMVNWHAVPLNGTPPFTFRWEFGDGQSSPEQVGQVVYTNPGTHAARVTITDAQGARASARGTVDIAPDLVVTASSDFRGGAAPVTVRFRSQAVGGTPPYNYTWDLGSYGGIVAGQDQVVHIPHTTSGFFEVTVQDSWGELERAAVRIQMEPPRGLPGLDVVALAAVLMGAAAAQRMRVR